MSRPLTPLKFDFGTPVRHVDKIHSCKHCERITIESHHLQDWKGKGAMVPLPYTKAEARLAAQDECPLFEHLARLSKPGVSRRELWEVLKICIEGRPKYSDDWSQIPSPLVTEPRGNIKHILRFRMKRLVYLVRQVLCQQLYLVFSRKELRIYWLMRCDQMKLSQGPYPMMMSVVRYNVTAAQSEYCASCRVPIVVLTGPKTILPQRPLLSVHSILTYPQPRLLHWPNNG